MDKQDFIEMYYPNYSKCDKVAELNDLTTLLEQTVSGFNRFEQLENELFSAAKAKYDTVHKISQPKYRTGDVVTVNMFQKEIKLTIESSHMYEFDTLEKELTGETNPGVEYHVKENQSLVINETEIL